jgi:hypothetical protein
MKMITNNAEKNIKYTGNSGLNPKVLKRASPFRPLSPSTKKYRGEI